MIKFFFKLAAFLVLLLSSTAHAGLITDLTENDYITIDELDWAWASTVNVENHTATGNTLSGPGGDFGWRYATIDELSLFKSDSTALSLLQYEDANGVIAYKNALSYWNDIILELKLGPVIFGINNDIDDFNDDFINSALTADPGQFDYLTFYVRNTPSQVPEPTTIMIFAIALIALSLRKRAIK
jgi:hypothetical protein